MLPPLLVQYVTLSELITLATMSGVPSCEGGGGGRTPHHQPTKRATSVSAYCLLLQTGAHACFSCALLLCMCGPVWDDAALGLLTEQDDVAARRRLPLPFGVQVQLVPEGCPALPSQSYFTVTHTVHVLDGNGRHAIQTAGHLVRYPVHTVHWGSHQKARQEGHPQCPSPCHVDGGRGPAQARTWAPSLRQPGAQLEVPGAVRLGSHSTSALPGV